MTYFMKYIISLGGSIVVPKSGIDTAYLKKFRRVILTQVKKGHSFYIIVGGGVTCRVYQAAASKITKVSYEDNDWVGIAANRLNAELVRAVFGQAACPKVVIDYGKKINTKAKIVIGAGWKPGWSTDYDAVLLAEMHNIKTVINLSNIDYVYTKDPNKFSDAKKIETINWTDFRKIVGNKWTPGLNKPFDPIAAKLAEKLNLKVVIMNGNKLSELENIFNNKKFQGTTVA